jgi:hypothetical protein
MTALNSVMEKLVANDFIFGGLIASLMIASALIVVYFNGYKAGYRAGCDYIYKRVSEDFGR